MPSSTGPRAAVALMLLMASACVALATGRRLATVPADATPDWRQAGYKTNKPTIGILAQRCE
jgi:hypothetical protein